MDEKSYKFTVKMSRNKSKEKELKDEKLYNQMMKN